MNACVSCSSQVETQDIFCKNCGTSLKKYFSLPGTPLNKLQVKSIPEQALTFLPLPYFLNQVVFWELILMIDFILCRFYVPQAQNLPLFSALIGFFILISISIIYCSKLLADFFPKLKSFVDEPEQQIFQWYKNHLRSAYSSMYAFIFAALFSAAASYTVSSMVKELSYGENIVYLFRMAFIALGFLVLGLGVWAIIVIMKLTSELGEKKVKITVYQNPNSSVLALGTVFLKMTLSIALSYAMIVFTASLSPYGNMLAVWVWIGLGALAVLAFFFVPQYGMHKIMSREKEERLESFSKHLEAALEKSLQSPEPENMKRLKELFELQNHLNEMKEWPFNYNTIWQLISALFIPIILAIVDIMFKGN